MKKILLLSLVLTLTFSANVSLAIPDDCATIQDGTIMYSAEHYLSGQPLVIGYDAYGYNYQAYMFKGSYANVYLGRDDFPPYDGDDATYLAANPGAAGHWAWQYRDIQLTMKWSDEWLSNKDCNDDGKLDRGYSCDPTGANNSACTGAWLTNHMWGSDPVDGKACNWNYFTKIITPSLDADKESDYWYNADGVVIGPVIWGGFATVMEVENDPCNDIHGLQYSSPDHPGFGGW